MKRPRMNSVVFHHLSHGEEEERLQVYNRGKREWLATIALISLFICVAFAIFADNKAAKVFGPTFSIGFAITAVCAFNNERLHKQVWYDLVRTAERFERITNVSVSLEESEFKKRIEITLMNMAASIAMLENKIVKMTNLKVHPNSDSMVEIRRNHLQATELFDAAINATIRVSGTHIIKNLGHSADILKHARDRYETIRLKEAVLVS